MATVDLRTLPISEQHHSLAFNPLGRTGRDASDFLWICPTCDDGKTHLPNAWAGHKGYFHFAGGNEWDDPDDAAHQLVAVDIIAVVEQWRQIGFHLQQGTPWAFDHMLDLGAPREPVDA